MSIPNQSRRPVRHQQGYVLLLLMLMVTLVLLSLIALAPGVIGQLRHDREDEMIHRGAQYARAVRLFYKKNNTWPTSLDQLKETNKRRYIRRLYKDPLTGENFKPLRGSDITQAGVRPSGLLGSASGASTQSSSTSDGSAASGSTPTTSTGGAQAGGTGSGTATSGDSTTTPPAAGATPTSGTTGSTTPSGSPFGTLSGGSNAQPTTSGASSSSSTSSASGTNSLFGGGLNQTTTAGAVFGGGAIVGVASQSPRKGFHIFNKKEEYKDWMFIYDPTLEGKTGLIKGPYNGPQTTGTGTIPGATPAGQLNAPSSSISQPQSPTR